MSTGAKIPFKDALLMAAEVVHCLKPHCVRLKAAGSLRRRRPEVSDIEIVLEPRMITVDLFQSEEAPDIGPIKAELLKLGTWVKGGQRMMQVTDLLGRKGTSLDVFLVWPPAQWGSILAIRTGPADLGQLCVTKMRNFDYRHEGGRALRVGTDELVPTPTEEDFFALANIPCLAPRLRDDQLRALTRRRA